jgi:hypothetical protein
MTGLRAIRATCYAACYNVRRGSHASGGRDEDFPCGDSGWIDCGPRRLPRRSSRPTISACNPERVFNRAEGIRQKGDEKALKAFTAGAVLSGTCVSLKSGASVFTEGKGKGDGVIKIRPKGSYKTFFTSELAVQQP